MIVRYAEVSQPDWNDELHMGEPHWLGSTEKITTGVSTCIAMAAHNKTTRLGLLGHFSVPAITDPRIGNQAEFIDAVQALPELGPLAETELVLLGGAPYPKDGKDSTEEDRVYCEETIHTYLGKHGLSEVQLPSVWTPPKHTIDVEINAMTGVVTVDKKYKPDLYK